MKWRRVFCCFYLQTLVIWYSWCNITNIKQDIDTHWATFQLENSKSSQYQPKWIYFKLFDHWEALPCNKHFLMFSYIYIFFSYFISIYDIHLHFYICINWAVLLELDYDDGSCSFSDLSWRKQQINRRKESLLQADLCLLLTMSPQSVAAISYKYCQQYS